jgi:hypothetical protein
MAEILDDFYNNGVRKETDHLTTGVGSAIMVEVRKNNIKGNEFQMSRINYNTIDTTKTSWNVRSHSGFGYRQNPACEG